MGGEENDHGCCICPTESDVQDDCCKNEAIIVKGESKEHQASKAFSCEYAPSSEEAVLGDLPEAIGAVVLPLSYAEFVPRPERILFCVYRI